MSLVELLTALKHAGAANNKEEVRALFAQLEREHPRVFAEFLVRYAVASD